METEACVVDQRVALLATTVKLRAGAAIALATVGLMAGPGLRGRAELAEPWHFLAPLPQGNTLLAAWAAAPDDLFVAGHGGVILHWNGSQWRPHRTPTHKTIFALHGTSPTDLWAVGGDPYTDNQTNRCLILHFDGAQWTEQTPPRFGNTTYPLNAVWAIAPNDVWATQDSGTFVAHYDGNRWDLVSLPLGLELYSSFRAVTAAGPDHLFLAGTHGQIAHRDHGTWRLEQKLESGSFSVNLIGTLRAFDPDHVFAAGNWNQFYRRRNDGVWDTIPLPSSGPFGESLFVIGGTSPEDVYLMGVQSILHYTGATPVTRLDLSLDMRRQWLAGCSVGNRLYGVGPNGVAHEYRLENQGGGTLSPLTAGGNGDLRLRLNGAAGCGARGIIAYGFTFELSSEPPLLYFEHGTYHRFPSLPDGMQGSTEVKAVLAGGLDDVTIAWENFGDFQRGIAHWDGRHWTPVTGRSEQIRGAVSLAKSAAGQLYAAEPFRLLHRTQDDDWVVDFALGQEQYEDPLALMAFRSPTEVYFATKQGRIHRFDGATLKKESTPAQTASITALLTTDTETFAVGQHGLAWRRGAAGWELLRGIAPRENESFTALARNTTGIFASQSTPGNFTGGGLGRVWRFVNGTAQLEVEGLSQNLEAMAATASGALIGLTVQDFVVTRDTDAAAPSPTLVRLDTTTNWQALATSGVSIRIPSTPTSRPVIGLLRTADPLPFASARMPTPPAPLAHGETWRLFKDRFNRGTAMGPIQVQVGYRPESLPEPWRTGALPLALLKEGATEATPSDWDPDHASVTTREPWDATIWTLQAGASTILAPTLNWTRSNDGRIRLTWNPGTTATTLESAPNLGPGASWSTAEGVVVAPGGERSATLDTSPGSRFFRLRAGP